MTSSADHSPQAPTRSCRPLAHAARAMLGACLLLLLAPLSGCSDEAPSVTSTFKAFGDAVDVKMVRVTPDQAKRAADLIRDDFVTLERDLNTWSDGSMARINRLLPTGETFSAPESILPLIHLSQRYSELSGGLFNPSIGKLIALWGFNTEVPEGMRPPPDHAIRRLLEANPQMSDILVNALDLQGRNTALRLDFAPLIRAYAIDLAIARLREMDISDAQVQSGSDLRAIGSRSGRPWRTTIRKASGAGVFATVDVAGDESIVTRAAHDRDWIYNGVAYHYILDPRSGRPARGTQSVTVIHNEATVAAAAAIALFVAGPEHWYPIAQHLGIHHVALVDSEGTVHLNPELRERIQIIDRDAPLELSPPLDQTAARSKPERGGPIAGL